MRAYIIGNATMDESYVVATLPQPGESIKATAVNRCLGGKGANQAVILSRCGIDTTLITATANDQRGQDIRHLLGQEPLSAQYIKTDIQISDESILLCRADGENAVISTTTCAEQLQLANVAPMLAEAQPNDNLILQGNLSVSATHDLLAYARQAGLKTIFNPSPVHNEFTDFWELVDVLFLNSGEANALSGKTGTNAAHFLLEQGISRVVLTDGASGVWLAADDAVTHVPADAVTAIDTTGAGDTFMSVAIGSAGLRGTQIDKVAMQHAHQAAAITVSRQGTVSAFPSADELGHLLATSVENDGNQ